MKQKNITKDKLQGKFFIEFQKMLIEKHISLINENKEKKTFRIIDRSLIDAYAYLDSEIELKDLKEYEENLRKMENSIVIHFPYYEKFVKDDRTRILPSPKNEESYKKLCKLFPRCYSLKKIKIEERFEEILEAIRKFVN